MPYIQANQLKFYYEVHGSGEPVILINGLYSTTQSWLKQVEELKKHYQVYVYDCRDQGKTEVPKGDYVIHDHVEDLKALMSAWNLQKANIVSVSHGSFIGSRFAAFYPESVLKLVLISSVSEETAHGTYLYNFSRMLRDEYGMKVYYKMLMTYAFGETYFEKIAPKIDEIADDFEKRSKESVSLHRILNIARQHYPFTKELHKITAKTLLVTGVQDRYTPVSRAKIMNQNIKDSKLILLKDCGHSVHLEKPEELSQILIDFLSNSNKIGE